MVGRTEQAIWNGDRWYGGAVSHTLATGSSSANRKLHHEEARAYFITTTGTGTATAIWNAPTSSVAIAIVDNSGTVTTLAAGRSVQMYLHDLEPGAGNSGWTALDDGTSGVLSGPRSKLS